MAPSKIPANVSLHAVCISKETEGSLCSWLNSYCSFKQPDQRKLRVDRKKYWRWCFRAFWRNLCRSPLFPIHSPCFLALRSLFPLVCLSVCLRPVRSILQFLTGDLKRGRDMKHGNPFSCLLLYFRFCCQFSYRDRYRRNPKWQRRIKIMNEAQKRATTTYVHSK